VTREELRSVARLHRELGNVIGVLANDPHLRAHPGAIVGVLGVLAEDITRADAAATRKQLVHEDITDAVDYLRGLRSVKVGRL
jgi:hypothetical protein